MYRGGGGGIRTHEELPPLPVFKTGAFNRSATPPDLSFMPQGEPLSQEFRCEKAMLNHRHAAIDMDRLAGDIVSCGTCKENGCGRNVLRTSHASHGDVAENFFFHPIG